MGQLHLEFGKMGGSGDLWFFSKTLWFFSKRYGFFQTLWFFSKTIFQNLLKRPKMNVSKICQIFGRMGPDPIPTYAVNPLTRLSVVNTTNKLGIGIHSLESRLCWYDLALEAAETRIIKIRLVGSQCKKPTDAS